MVIEEMIVERGERRNCLEKKEEEIWVVRATMFYGGQCVRLEARGSWSKLREHWRGSYNMPAETARKSQADQEGQGIDGDCSRRSHLSPFFVTSIYCHIW